MLRIGILETGAPRPDLAARFGRYDAMVERLLGNQYPTTTFAINRNVFPETIESCDVYVLPGSASGVYDGDPWIARLKTFLGEAQGRAKLVGICFGHQIMAEAFGGRVEKSSKGWGLGLHRYQLYEQPHWMDSQESVAIPVSHQDQVVTVSPDARLIGGNAFTPHGILAYPDRKAVSFQFHPEFETAYAQALVEMRRDKLGSEVTDQAMRTLSDPHDSDRVAGWIRRFIEA